MTSRYKINTNINYNKNIYFIPQYIYYMRITGLQKNWEYTYRWKTGHEPGTELEMDPSDSNASKVKAMTKWLVKSLSGKGAPLCQSNPANINSLSLNYKKKDVDKVID